MRYLISALLGALATAAPAAPPVEVPTDLYMPLVPGMAWQYEDLHRNRRVTVKSSQEDGESEPTIRVDSDHFDLARLFRVGGGARILLREIATPGRIHDYRGDPIPFAAGPEIEVPSTYEFIPTTFRMPRGGGPTRWTISARRLVDREVPFGTFRNCLELGVRVLDWRTGERLSNLVMYFAPGLGLVEERGFHFGVPIDRKLTWYYSPLDESGVE
jgi:hypothetical protein